MQAYIDFFGTSLYQHFIKEAKPAYNISGLSHVGMSGGLENEKSLRFLVELFGKTRPRLEKVLKQRALDRDFIDTRTKACALYNQTLKLDVTDPDYKTVIGLEDGEGRIVFGPKKASFYKAENEKSVAPLPEFLRGPHVTLFGPPDSTKLSINAMNAYHRVLKNEPAIIGELLKTHQSVPKWGADDEDSKTPLRQDLIEAGTNLTHCFDKSIRLDENGKKYELQKDHLSLPLKRFPGLALPCAFMFYEGSPLPLHLYDFALHFFHNYKNAEALTFYVPKLENEEEASYVKFMLQTAEEMIQKIDSSYKIGTIRLMIVLENPRAIVRTNEIMDELFPYFAGASLGWHDYLASTARLFKEDQNYRIPVKADPNIVIKYIKASHHLLADVVGPRGGIKVGGMYGVLPLSTDLDSDTFQITMKGYFKDVITQLKRNLTGFWVAHPDFVRIGLALMEAWNFYQKGDKTKLHNLVKSLLKEKYHAEMLNFIDGNDIESLDKTNPRYVRSLVVADLKESDFIKNNHPDEIRYNVFQSLQYLTDWLSGNGCVALPANIEGVAVRVMDDLATAERSRWEVWHEIYHGRFSIEEFLKIAHEEMHFIRKDLSNDKKIVQVKYDARTMKWYPVAMKLMIKLMTDTKPCEFATELLIPFTNETIRNSDDPWALISKVAPEKYSLRKDVERFDYYFERCGTLSFAQSLSANSFLDMQQVKTKILSFNKSEILEAASFHGDIGESKATLDAMASQEQALVFGEEEKVKEELRQLGTLYRTKFGMKFLISAKGKSGKELLAALKERMNNSETQELDNARMALFEITQKRMMDQPLDSVLSSLENLLTKHKLTGAQISILENNHIQTIALGEAEKGKRKVTKDTWFELASLSKTVGSSVAMEYFKSQGIELTTPVNQLFAQTASPFRLKSLDQNHPEWAEKVTIADLMAHSALNMHYVNGVPANKIMPPIKEFLEGNDEYGYKAIGVINDPGTKFQYSGGGFIVLEHLLEAHSKKTRFELTSQFLQKMGMNNFSFEQQTLPGKDYAHGYNVKGEGINGTRLMFPSFAAGAMGSSESMAKYLEHLTTAYHELYSELPLSHDTARIMLHAFDKGCQDFMGCNMGLGIFVAEGGENKIAIHQGANDGFRGIYAHCFFGPDKGKGFVVLCNGELNGVLFNAEVSQTLFKALNFSGIDFSKFQMNFTSDNISQEEVVNIGYKKLVFDAFIPTRPEEIIVKGPIDPWSDFNLAVGGRIESVTNERFARAENLLSPHIPVFDPELFGRQGKIMDSWETVRHNPLVADELVFSLKKASAINYIKLCTKYHFGNQVEHVEIFAWNTKTNQWDELLSKRKLEGHAYEYIALKPNNQIYTKIKVIAHPDGGFSRLGLYCDLPEDVQKLFKPVEQSLSTRYTEVIPHTKKPLNISYKPTIEEVKKNLSRYKTGEEIDVANLAFGASLVRASNEHYGPAIQVISPFRPMNMFDGLESARSRKPGHSEEVVIRLAKPSKLLRVEMDFTYFVNNNPLFVSVEGFNGQDWISLVKKTKVKAFAGNAKSFSIDSLESIQDLRVVTYPDGGMNRLRAYAKI